MEARGCPFPPEKEKRTEGDEDYDGYERLACLRGISAGMCVHR